MLKISKPALPPFADDAFPSEGRSAGLTARLGSMLGAAITVCFLTGLVSHVHQHPVVWLPLPADPAWGYRLTQGLHVATGIAAFPIFFAKMWSVYPLLFSWPPVRSVVHGVERLTVALLAGATFFELLTGVFNVAHLYLWPFFFPAAHYAIAWVVVGSVALHLAVKWPTVREALGQPLQPVAQPIGSDTSQARQALSRRAILLATVSAAGAATVTTVGQTLVPLQTLGLLAPRSPAHVPGGLPINRTARDAGVITAAINPTYRLSVAGPHPRVFTIADLGELEQVDVTLPIACVEGWSAVGLWGGVRLRDLLDLCQVPADATVRAVSLEMDGLYSSAEISPAFARHEDTLLALRLGGAPLAIDHGYPVRLIAPNRPGVLQTKWVTRVELV